MIYEDSDNKNNKNNRWDVHGLKAQKEPSPGQSETSWSGTLCKMYPDGPRPAGARGNVRNVNPDETSNVPCCHFAFPFGRRRVAPLPFPSAGDLRFRAQGMWVGRDPGCRSFHSLCPGLGSSCPDGAFVSTVFITSAGSNRLNQINPYSTLSPFRKSKTSDFFEVNIRTFDAKHPYFCPKKSDVLQLP